jgi:glucosamine-6-phosphate deaminase
VTIPLTVFPDAGALGRALAAQLADGIQTAAREGRRYVLGCPGGRTPRETYRALAAEVAARRLALGHVIVAMMDEYVTPELTSAPADAHYSCARFGRTEIVAPLNAGASDSGIAPGALWLPDPGDPARYDQRLRDAGGIDVFLLASGASDGHVAFNPPGSPRNATTRIVALPDTTRRDNLQTFPGFADLAEVPAYGVTVGVSTIAELSRRLVMIVTGTQKREAFRRLSTATAYDPSWPATIVVEGRHAEIYADDTAAHQESRAA